MLRSTSCIRPTRWAPATASRARAASCSGRSLRCCSSLPSAGDRLDELDQRGVDLVGLLLLHPVTSAVDQHCAAVIGKELHRCLWWCHQDDRVEATADEQ